MSRTSMDALFELAAGQDLTIHISAACSGKCMVSFEDVEEKSGALLKGITGRGETVEKAARSYLDEISGKRLVVNAMSKTHRREFTVLTMTESEAKKPRRSAKSWLERISLVIGYSPAELK